MSLDKGHGAPEDNPGAVIVWLAVALTWLLVTGLALLVWWLLRGG